MKPEHFSNPIRQLRAVTALSQAAFSERYGIPRRTLENWEAGTREPPTYVVDLLRYRIETEKGENL